MNEKEEIMQSKSDSENLTISTLTVDMKIPYNVAMEHFKDEIIRIYAGTLDKSIAEATKAWEDAYQNYSRRFHILCAIISLGCDFMSEEEDNQNE